MSSPNAIWKVLDRLRAESSLTSSEFGVALAALIYLRWADFQEAEQEAGAASDESGYEPVLPARLHWRFYHDRDPRELQYLFSTELPSVLEGFGNARHNSLATHLHRIAPVVARLGELPIGTLDHLVHWLASQPLETASDRRKLLEVLDGVLHRSRDKYAGQFFTPPTVVRLLVELAAPSGGERVYDPCFGSAGLLTAAVDYVQQQASDHVTRASQPLLQIAGVEINRDSYMIGLTRLALAGIANPKLELGNSLERTLSNNPHSDGFDVVLANPPWGNKVDLHGLDHFPIRTKDSAALFVQHALAQLRPGGRGVMVIPPSILFGSGAMLRLRQLLLEQHTVEAVVALPEGTFLPYTGIKSNILILRRGGATRSVRMFDADVLFVRPSGRNPAAPDDETVHELTQRLHGPEDGVRWDIDVQELAKVDWDLTPKRRDQSGLEQMLRSLPTEVNVLSLSHVCQVTSGHSISAHELQHTPLRPKFEPSALFPEIEGSEINPQHVFAFADNPIPYIRIRDVQNGVISKGSSWLGPVAASSIENRWKLCAGDILLSKSGTIGKAGIVRNAAVGAVAGNGFFVLRVTDGAVDPHYLLAYLHSAECNAWFNDRARGSGVRHLAMNVVKELPVPVPAIPIQQQVAEQWRQFGIDALSFLAELLSEDRSEPVAAAIDAWVDAKLVALDRRETSASIEGDLKVLEQIAASPCPLNICEDCGKPYFLDYDNQYMDAPHHYGKGIQTTCLACWLDVGPSTTTMDNLRAASPLVDWYFSFKTAISGLRNVSRIPTGVGLLNVLQSVGGKVNISLDTVKGHLPNAEKACRVTTGLKAIIESACNRLLLDVRLVFSVLSVSDIIDGVIEVILDVSNEGPLPLRELVLTTNPDLSTERVPYLAENSSHRAIFSGQVPSSLPTTFTLTVEWSGLNLTSEQIEGTRELPIEADRVWNSAQQSPTDLGPSPYVCGDPVKTDRPDVFVGREELLDQIRRQIMRSGNVVLLEGNRRAGKSSILWHLEGKDGVPGWLGVYCSLQGTEGDNLGGVPTAEVFRGIAYQIVQSIRKLSGSAVLPDGSVLDANRKLGIARSLRQGISDEGPFADFREYIELVLETLAKQGLGLLLMLDEFDKLQEGIDKGITSPQVPENIRFLVHTYPKLSAILTGSRRLKRLREEYWSALFGLGTRFGVSSLRKEPAERLVTEPVKGRLAYAKDAEDLAYTLTAGQPYLLQCLCNRIFDIAARTGTRSITVDQVREAAKALVEDNEHFASLWDYTMFERRRFLLAILHREAEGPDPLRLGVMQEKLAGHGVEIREDTLIADLDYLRDLELIDLHSEISGAYYTLTIPMMGDWIDHQQDFDALKSRTRAEMEDSDA